MRSNLVRVAFRHVAVVLVLALLGVLAGLLWWFWWKPVPEGVVVGHHPYFLPDEEFRGTGMYVVIALPLGLVVGIVGMWRLWRDPLLGVVTLLVGSVVAGAAMLVTGGLLGPESALELARSARDGAEANAALRAHPGAAWAALPFATALGCLGVLLSRDPLRPETPPIQG